MLSSGIELAIGLIAIVAAIALLAEKLKIPYPILLVLGGLALSFVPRLPPIEIDPKLVFYVFLPPLLFWAGILTSWRDFRANLRPILLLAVGLVLVTTFAVAGVAMWIVPGMGFAAACVLGAIVSPPDAIAATAITERLRVPRRVSAILEGESLVNDATALVALMFAIKAVELGSFSFPHAARDFFILSAGGIAIGLLVSWLSTQLQKRVHEPHVEGIISLLTPYFAYLPAEIFHCSGVLAVVAAGICISRQFPKSFSAESRMRMMSVWETLIFILNGTVFILIGQYLPTIINNLQLNKVPITGLVVQSAVICLTAIVVRVGWVFALAYLSRVMIHSLRTRARPPAGSLLVIGWAGMRGIVSLASALTVPMVIGGVPFPHRDKILFITFCVILATLVFQGLTLPLVIRLAGLPTDKQEEIEERQARLDAAHAALSRLTVLEFDESLDPHILASMRSEYEQRILALGGTIKDAIDPVHQVKARHFAEVRREVLTAERLMITMLRDQNVIGDDVLRRILREIDLEEAKLA
ncbi:MAG: Na+/H+ antiporter [Burkholderiales bacterium]|nr:Na+/H+ antiporter [Phycisphaerae bacterium]